MYKGADNKGVALVRELKSTRTFPEYNTMAVKHITTDINNIYNHMVDKVTAVQSNDLSDDHPDRISAGVDNLRIDRSKKCIYAYLNERANRLQKYYWQNGEEMAEHVNKNLSIEEMEYFSKYIDGVKGYNNGFKCKLISYKGYRMLLT